MSTKAKRHTHKYHHIQMGSQKLWACALPDCNHYMPKHMEGTVSGKNSLCWQCDDTFLLNDGNMQDDRPRCHKCRNPRAAAIGDFLGISGK